MKMPTQCFDPERAITQVRREFGEHGGVASSISVGITGDLQSRLKRVVFG